MGTHLEYAKPPVKISSLELLLEGYGLHQSHAVEVLAAQPCRNGVYFEQSTINDRAQLGEQLWMWIVLPWALIVRVVRSGGWCVIVHESAASSLLT